MLALAHARLLRTAPWIALFACAGGLSHQRTATAAAEDALGCPAEQITLEDRAAGSYRAAGCGAQVDLVCVGGTTDLRCSPGPVRHTPGAASASCAEAEARTGPGALSQPEYAAIVPHGKLSREIVRAEAEHHRTLVDACFECARERGHVPAGSLHATLLLSSMGRVAGVTVQSDAGPIDPQLAACLAGVVRGFRLPPPGGNAPYQTRIPLPLPPPDAP